MSNLQSCFLNEYAKAIVDTVREPFLVLSADLRVLMANNVFYMTFDISPEDTENYYFCELGSGQWNIPQLRMLLEDILPRSTSFHDFAITAEFDRIGRNTFLINARQLHQEGNSLEMILIAMENITERKRAEEALQKFHAELEKRVIQRTAELARANEALQRETVERMHAEKEQITVVLEERTRIAGTIHDTFAQGFAGIVIQLEAAEDALAEEPKVAMAHMLQARKLARESLIEARRSMWALRSQALEGRNLVTALALFVHQLTHDSTTHIKFTHCGTMPMVHNEMEDDLLRIAQEALTNALKHAQAPHINITLTFSVRQVELCVKDDGQGFDLTQQPFNRGFGIRIMKERAANMDGQLNIASQPGKGTRMVVRVPLPADNLFEASHE